ncbi:stage V sporulation protein D [Alkalithermobacter paradoxus]|uniref:Stage V sporulation protein D n=1 Tax=Alkalithermobacter paradoxus TaxID=29349 RepID=A0A1V4IA30_9FIRM|nr:stage V sporulation protein D [[Clostridium] thermoalcaliphilum]
MARLSIRNRKRLVMLLLVVIVAFFGLIFRIGYLQLVRGPWLRDRALSQQTRDIPIEAKRGTIYDRKGKELAVSITKHIVWAKPVEIKEPEKAAKSLAAILEEDEDVMLRRLKTKNMGLVRLARWIDDDKANEIRSLRLSGVWVTQDNKRYYPYGNFASYILGHVSADNAGVAAIELEYDKHLRGVPGRLIINTDASGREIPFSNERYNEPQDGMGVVLTIDEVIQHYAEKALDKALEINKAKRVYAIVMDVKTGDILAMAAKPDYDPNDPRKPLYQLFEEELAKYDEKDKIKGWFQMWRNPMVNDIYEPGSTFKLITSAAGIEEGVVTPEEEFYDKGYIMVADRKIKCWRHYNPHGRETFTEAVENSCNPVFVEVGQRLGVDKLYEYINAFGFTSATGIDLPGEGSGLMYSKKAVGPVELATISFGQSISVTPMQLITSIAAIANDGKLMKPRVVKELVDSKGNLIKRFEPELVRQVISSQTSRTIREIMESVVSNGSGKVAYIPGYRVGGKTGTAQKVIDGRYASGHYIASFVGIAPSDNPEIAVLVVIDEPRGESHFGSLTAGPVAKEIIYDTLRYLDIKPSYTEEEKADLVKEETTVPEVRNLKLSDAGKILLERNLNFTVEPHMHSEGDSVVIDMFPKPQAKVPVGSNIILYVKNNDSDLSTVIIPNLEGKTVKEVSNILQGLGLKLKIVGNGVAVNQNPRPDSQVDLNSTVTVEFK